MSETHLSRPLCARTTPHRARRRTLGSRLEQLETRWLMAADTLADDVLADDTAELRSDPIAEPAMLLPSGNANTTAESLLADGGPGDPALPGFNNVARSGDYGSVIYLGGGWALTANHVSLTSSITWAGKAYSVDTSSITRLKNADGSSTDLKMFKVQGDPQVPELLTSFIASAPASGHVYMVGNGLSATGVHYWSVNKSVTPWVWTEIAEPSNPNYTNYAGVTVAGPRVVRWGENNVHDSGLYMPIGGVNVAGFTTRFDRQPYTNQPGLPNEAQAAAGDSGGAVFSLENGRWVLSGVMLAVSGSASGQPSNTTVFGAISFMADLSAYRSQILSIAGVVNRQLVYNNSSYDERTAGVGAAEDAAIATDKVAYQAGAGVSTFDNISSYSRGINSVTVDIASLHGELTAADFSFHVGMGGSPETWAEAPRPSQISVRSGAGVGGSDRVNIIWPDGAIYDTWLEIKLMGNDTAGGFNTNTGLAKTDVFYFGHRPGDTGGETVTSATTNISDELAARFNSGLSQPVTSLYDFDKDKLVNIGDQLFARFNPGILLMLDLPATVASSLAVEGVDEFDGLIELPPMADMDEQSSDASQAARERLFAALADLPQPTSGLFAKGPALTGFLRRAKR